MIRVPSKKQLDDSPIASLPLPAEICLPLGRRVSTVAVGDTVRAGQPVARSVEAARWASVLHSPASGTWCRVDSSFVI